MPQLYPTYEVPEFIPENSRYDNKYKRSISWNPEIGDFVQDGANRMIECSGEEAFMTWCYKMALTERFRCAAYPSSIGVEMEEALKEPDGKAVESALERTITEALKVNPRTEYVRDFHFVWNGDRLSTSFIVKGIDSEEFKIIV